MKFKVKTPIYEPNVKRSELKKFHQCPALAGTEYCYRLLLDNAPFPVVFCNLQVLLLPVYYTHGDIYNFIYLSCSDFREKSLNVLSTKTQVIIHFKSVILITTAHFKPLTNVTLWTFESWDQALVSILCKHTD